jgi:3D (Asp-Asp-Asp) domain-containing protein
MAFLSRSLRRKLLATVLTAGVFTLLYQATVMDSQSEAGTPGTTPAVSRASFEATAYCRGETTASGVPVKAGIAAADPQVLPIGSVIRVDGVAQPYQGIYTVLDTGPEIRGREIDVYMWNCTEAKAFGRQNVLITVVRRGWHAQSRHEQ